jgi:hypothetical protein
MSKAHLPPVPPANRAPQGGSANADTSSDIANAKATGVQESKDRNLASQGRQGNIKTNTTNQGYQQDR